MGNARPPDIIVVILDTVRQSDCPGGSDPVPGLPTLEGLVRESVSFSHAFAPAPWTVPSHASLLTGRAPWEHGMHARGVTRLPAGSPTIPSELRPWGYRSVCLSANPYLGRSYGLTDGFDESYWGGWHEPFLRGLRLHPRYHGGSAARSSLAGLAAQQLTNSFANAIQRHPMAWDSAIRWARNLRSEGVPEGAVAGWIEPVLESFLAKQPADRPVFALVNIHDAHQPYNGLPRDAGGFPSPRQDRGSWVRGAWSPTAPELAELRNAYRSTYPILDDRIGRIADLLRTRGRWENSVVIVTSDHGQSFGEHGVLYHGLRTDETLLRVPLVVRWPGGFGAGQVSPARVSIAAIHDLALAAASGRAPPWDPSLSSPGPSVGPIPTAIADGLLTPPGQLIPPARRAMLDRTFVAAYDGARKVTLDVNSGQLTEFDLERDPMERAPVDDPDPADGHDLRRHLRTVARETFGTTLTGGVAERLASWGYL